MEEASSTVDDDAVRMDGKEVDSYQLYIVNSLRMRVRLALSRAVEILSHPKEPFYHSARVPQPQARR